MENSIGEYEILRKLSDFTLLGKDKLGNMKILKSYSSSYCIDERKLESLKLIKCKGISPALSTFEFSGKKYIVRDYCEGDNLKNYLEKKKNLSEQTVLEILNKIISICCVLRENGLIHGNLKPENIFIEDEKKINVVLTDFLFTKEKAFDDEQYCEPETIFENTKPNPSSEVFSIGLIMRLMINCCDIEFNEICLDFMNKCLQMDSKKRIQFDEMTVHSYLTSIDVTKAFAENNLYICSCSRSRPVSLDCGDSFCIGCIAKLNWRSKFVSDEIKKIEYEFLNKKNVHKFDLIKILCPKCLSYSKMTIHLRCGCRLKKDNLNNVLIWDKRGKNKRVYVCKTHKQKINIIEQRAIYGFPETRLNETAKTILEKMNLDNAVDCINIFNFNIDADDIKAIAGMLKTNTSLNYINFKGINIGSEGAKLISESLKNNDSLIYIHLKGCALDKLGVKIIAEALKINNTLNSINLNNNNVGDEGAESIAEALKLNKSLKSIYLRGNEFNGYKIDSQGAKALAELLKINISLNYLNLNNNNIGDKGAEAIAKMLKINKSLNSIRLKNNHITEKGAIAIAESLKLNNTLSCIDLEENFICNKGLRLITDALKNNKSLKYFFLGKNSIVDKDIKSIAELLKINHFLERIYLDNNEFGYESAKQIVEALKFNDSINYISVSYNYAEPGFATELQKDTRIVIKLSSNRIYKSQKCCE